MKHYQKEQPVSLLQEENKMVQKGKDEDLVTRR
jgi:hypothetical protein